MSGMIKSPVHSVVDSETLFVERFNEMQNIPFGSTMLQAFNDGIDTLLKMPFQQADLVEMCAAKGIYDVKDKDTVFIHGKQGVKINKIMNAKVVIIVAPYRMTIEAIDADYIYVIGGKHLTINTLNTKTLVVYGTKILDIGDVYADVLIGIVNEFNVIGLIYDVYNTTVACNVLNMGKAKTERNNKYMFAIGKGSISKLNTKILDIYPNMYLGTKEYATFDKMFEISPEIVNTRITWLVWAMFGVNHKTVVTNDTHNNLLTDPEINTRPIHLKMSRFVHERNYMFDPFLVTHINDESIMQTKEGAEALSTERKRINVIDMIYDNFVKIYGKHEVTYKIKAIYRRRKQ